MLLYGQSNISNYASSQIMQKDNLFSFFPVSDDGREPDFLSALRQLTQKLFSMEMESGHALKESVLAREFNVSRPAIREALSQAVGWRLVDYVPYCGYRIHVFTLGDLRDWVEMREAIEPLAARRLASRGLTASEKKELHRLLEKCLVPLAQRQDPADLLRDDMAFHYAIVRMSGNSRFNTPEIAAFYNSVKRHHHRRLWKILAYFHDPMRASFQNVDEFFASTEPVTNHSHELILQALESKDPLGAEAHVRSHCARQTQNVQRAVALFENEDLALDDLDKTKVMKEILKQIEGDKTERKAI